MTIALAVRAVDGVVLAADTQETYPGFWKLDQGKVKSINAPINGRARSCLISGAGDALYIDSFCDRVRDAFLSTQPIPLDVKATTPFIDELDVAFGVALREFYQQHVVPFTAYPILERPDVQMLIAVYRQPFGTIWESHHNVLQQRGTHAAVGAGAFLAKTFLDLFVIGTLDMWGSALLAGFVVAKVKESVDGCGQFTDVVCSNDVGTFRVPHELTARLDDLVRRYSADLDRHMLWHILGDAQSDVRQLTKTTKSLRTEFSELAKQMAQQSHGPKLSRGS